MNKNDSSNGILNSFLVSAHVIRFSVATLMLSGLVACVVAPTETVDSETISTVELKTGMAGAADMYNSHNYPGAIREFDAVINDAASSANSRRLAHLGKALVYLGPDVNWHSIDNAELSLISAGQIAPDETQEFSVETDLLMDAISAVIGTESKYSVLAAKSNGSGNEVKELKRELDSVKTRRDALIAEQKVLNEAIDKLKALTLGS